MMPQTIDLEKEMAKQQAQQDAAMQAEQEIKKQAAEAAVLNYQEKRKELESKRDSAQKESYQSGVEIRPDKIGKMVPMSPGSSKGRLIFEDQMFPIMSTRLTPEGQKQYDEAVSQLTSLEQEHQSKLSDSFYKSSYDTAATAQNIKSAESKLESLKAQKAAVEATPYPTPQGKSDWSRRQAQEAQRERQNQINNLTRQITEAESYLTKASVNPLSLSPDEKLDEIRYSSPSNAVGYNSLTGRVEVGAFGAGGSHVVSQSKAEDIMDLQRIGKEAGYTKGATIDSRINVFKTVDTGILTPGLKAQPSPEIVRQFSGPTQPQRTHPNILTNQPDSKYANPSFVTKEQQKKTDELNQFVKGSASALPEGADTYSLTFADGSKIEGLTKQQAQEYVKTFKLGQDVAKLQRQTQRTKVIDFLKEAKAQGFTLLDVTKDGRKETVPIDSAFGRIITGGEARISYQDPKLRQARIDFVETRRAQKKWIKEVEKSGAGFISITTATGAKVVPVSEAWAEIRKAPPDAKISTKLPVAEKSVGPDQQTRDIMKFEQGRRAISQDPLSQLTYASEKQKTGTILPGGAGEFEREIGTQALSLVSGVVNLAENVDVGIRRGVGNMFKTPESKLSKFPEPSAQLYVAPSYEAAYLGAAQEGLSKSAKPTDIGFGIKVSLPTLQTFGVAGKILSDYEKTQSPNKLLAQKSFAALQFVDPAIVPLRQVKIATALETRVPTLIGAPRLSSKVTDVAKGLKIGYSPEVSRLELVKIKDGPVVAGVPRPDKIPQLEKVRGLEGRGGYPITEDTSGYMTRKPTLEYLTKKGVLQKDEADILQQAKPYLKKSGKYKDEVKRTTLPSQPVLSLEEGKETTAAFKKLESEQFKKNPTVGSLFGSTTEQFYVLDEFVEKSRDIDIHPMGKNAGPKAQKIAREFAQDIQDVARPERQFAVKTSYVDEIKLATGEKTGKKEIDRITISVETKPRTGIKPDFDETMGIGADVNNIQRANPNSLLKLKDGSVIVFRAEPGKIRKTADKAAYELRLDRQGLTTEQYKKWEDWPKNNAGVSRNFFFKEIGKNRLFVAPSLSEAEGWYGRLNFGKTLTPKPQNIAVIKIKPNAVLEKDVNVFGSNKPIDKTKPTVFASEVDILTPNEGEWIVLNEDVIEDIRTAASKRSEKMLYEKSSPAIKPDFDETMWVGKTEKELAFENIQGVSFYHGTTLSRAQEILSRGFSFSKAQTSMIEKGTVFLAREPEYSVNYAAWSNVNRKGAPVTDNAVLKIKGDPDTIADVYKLEEEAGKQLSTEQAIIMAKKKGYLAIDLGKEGEIQVLSSKFFKGIKQIGKTDSEWGLATNLNKKGGRIRPGSVEDVKVIDTSKRKIIEGKEFDTKVSEFIVKSNDDKATGYGYKATDAKKVMGFDVPDKSITIQDVKIGEYTGKQKIQTLRRQELRRLSAGFELQFEKDKFGSLRADPGREKEYAKIYAIAKTREAQAIKANKMDDAKLFSDYAESVKRFAEKRGIWKVGQYVDLADDSGVLTDPSLKDKTVNSLISTSETASRNPTTLINTVTPKNQYSPPEKDFPSFSTPKRSSSSSVLKYSSSSDVLRPTQSTLSRIKRVQSESTTPSRINRSSRTGSDTPSNLNQRSPRSAIPSSRPQNYGRYNPLSKTPYGRSPPSAIPSRIPSTITTRSIITGPPSKIPNMTVKPLKPVIPLYSETVPPKQIKIVTPPLIKTRTDKQKPNPPKGREDFFGSSHAAEVLGFRTKKKEFDYGDEKTARLVEQDIKLTTAGRDAFVRSGRKRNIISKTKKNIIAPEKSKTFSKAGKWKSIW